MRIIDLLDRRGIRIVDSAMSKEEALAALAELAESAGNVRDRAVFLSEVQEREAQVTTGIGHGVAIPHAKSASVKQLGLSAMVVRDGVDFNALDAQPVQLLFLIAVPETADSAHIQLLSRLATLLLKPEFAQELISSTSTADFLEKIQQAECEQIDNAAEADPAQSEVSHHVLAVTACPVGVAHTYLAAEGLKRAAQKLDVNLQVETNGASGVNNELTAQDIQECDAVIVAVDRAIPLDRFEGKPLLLTSAAEAVRRPEGLLQKAISGDLPVHSNETKEKKSLFSQQSSGILGKKLYNILMSGISYMLPFVVGGGILTALAYLFDSAASGSTFFGQGNSVSALLYGVGQLSFAMIFPVLSAYIGASIADRPALLLGFVGGILASGLGQMYFNGSSSGFFGSLLAGFLAGWIVLLLKKVFDFLPKNVQSLKPFLIYPVLGTLLIGIIMVYIVNPPLSAFNSWLIHLLQGMGDGSKVLLGCLLGGMMAIDFGGPINKAAYLFGTLSITAGQPYIMAAVMAGGMIPPLAIALCATFFPELFSKREGQMGMACYVMGLCFITEGAIPFAVASPLRVIPACAVGSALAGGLSMFFGCTVSAPHGGIFVLFLVEHWQMFLFALAVGSMVGMFFLAALKKLKKTSVS